MSGFPCRCSKCKTRKTLPRRPETYVQAPKCWNCKNRKWFIDSYRVSKNPKDSGEVCCCAGRILPHRKAQKGCIYHRDNVEALKLVAENNAEHKPINHLEFYGDFE